VGTGSGPSANDGLGDAGTNPYSGSSFNISQGTHYVAMAGTSIIKIEIKPSVTFSGSGTAGYILSVLPVNQTGSITSNLGVTSGTTLGTTYHKGSNGSKVADGVDSSGTFQANTVWPLIGSSSSITYTGSSIGSWSNGSTYALSLSSSPTSSTGTFSGAQSTGSVTGTYQSSSPSTDTATLALNDGSDSVSETVLYVTTFHKGAEQVSITSGPTEIAGDTNNPRQVATFSNPSYTDSFPVNTTFSVDFSPATTLTISPCSPQAVEVLESILNIQPLGVHTNTYVIPANFSVPPRQTTTIYAYLPIDDEKGTCDIYGSNGFQGSGTFDVNLPEANAKLIPPTFSQIPNSN
jgi:hypothetical protein